MCGDQKCKVPVLVCDGCKNKIEANTRKNSFKKKGSSNWNVNKNDNPSRDSKNLRCPLCKAGKNLRSVEPVDSAAQKRLLTLEGSNAKINSSNKRRRKESKTLFIGKLPLSVTATEIKDALKIERTVFSSRRRRLPSARSEKTRRNRVDDGLKNWFLLRQRDRETLEQRPLSRAVRRIQNESASNPEQVYRRRVLRRRSEEEQNKDDDVKRRGRYKRLFKKGERPPVVCT